MTGSIILTEGNLSPTGVFNSSQVFAPFNRLTLNMRGLNIQGRRIGLKKLNIYYSWPNIRSATSITVSWRIGASYTDYTWTLPALTNYPSVSVLNQSLQTFCIANGLYLRDSSGNNVYYLQLQANPTTYKIDLLLFAVPTSLPATFTQPSNFAGYPSVSRTPRFTIPVNSELSSIIGFEPDTYDGVGANIVFSSVFVPQLSPVSTVFITCNIAKNDVPINGSTVIQAFTTRGTEYGAMIEVAPSEITYYEIDSNSNNLEIMFFDQNFNQLYIQDPQITVHLEVA
jgi:hypothetical protein